MFQNPNNHKMHIQKRKGWETLINSLAECEKAAVWKGRMVMNKFYFCGTLLPVQVQTSVSRKKRHLIRKKSYMFKCINFNAIMHSLIWIKLKFKTINNFDTFLKLLIKEFKQFLKVINYRVIRHKHI
jgi:hypothetical protein